MITVFTPTYNRAHLLKNLYESLCKQTYKDFEWLVVDDGSNDNTKEIVMSFIEEGKITIRYFQQENGGKHRAINRGAREANGELFFIVDSDDKLPFNSLSDVWTNYLLIRDNNLYAGVCGFDTDEKGNIIGGGMEYDYLDCTFRELRDKYNINGDMADVYRTSIFKEFPFPEIPGENFCAESILWNRMSQKYIVRYINRIIYNAEYLPDGLSNNNTKARMLSPVSTCTLYSEQLSLRIPFILKLKTAINYWRFWVCIPPKNSCYKNDIKIANIWKLLFPFGLLMHFQDRKRIKHHG